MSDLTAVDILMLPDATMIERARELNTQMHQSVPDGFALDAHHRPHITLLQRYVRTSELTPVFDVVADAIGAADPDALQLRGVRVAHMQVASQAGMGLAGLVVEPSQAVLDLQRSLIAAVEPFAAQGGTAAAYVTTAEAPEINADTIEYVERYVPDHSGNNFVAHVTVGLAQLDFLTDLESRPFDAFTFHPAGFAVFQLGNNGTAQREMQTWDFTQTGRSPSGRQS
ncbi:hypothetical protein G3I60_35750 [Streptomyces sp. SID13666]|uniref:hypothetical protein n=1 Tax=unclassified Streptomyces TaxID=2593676 RepID=UPI0013C1D089|nr:MULTISPECIES: hypothetical protein [unclassified Streptomyces]MCZ4102593.1 hypothetical protein [Streptomyces sp. H39-C1]NEA59375.1 hypothetical protein [Streptomyces sp. SID13666]